jgi:hypothetical protein
VSFNLNEKDNPMSEAARNFKEMREMESADEIRESIKQGILGRAREYLGGTYEAGQNLAQESGLMGALNDIYRRVFENGWFGKDIFDERFQSDTQQMGTGYDQRAAFYGLDKPQEQAQDREQERGDDLER